MMKAFKISLLAAFSLLLFLSSSVMAEKDHHAHHRNHEKAKLEVGLAKVTLPDVMLVNQYGKAVDFKKDVVADRISVVTFAYTTCTTVCPVVSVIFSQVYKKLKTLMGTQVELITLTVDPNRDTPARLLAYSKKHRGGKGWTWLSGKKKDVITTLNAFGAYTVNFEDHPAMILVGDASQNRWYRFYGFTSPKLISEKVKDLLQQRSEKI
jgi:protein SCO1/2